MALRRALTKHLHSHTTKLNSATRTRTNISRIASPSAESSLDSYARQSLRRLPFFPPSVGDKLNEKINSINFNEKYICFDELGVPEVDDVKKLLRLAQVERLKMKIKEVPKSSIMYDEFVKICGSYDFAKLMDETGHVVVLGNVVFLRPDQVAKSMESLITQSIAIPNDPRRKELKQMEKKKSIIDQKARAQVRSELYSGLALMMFQTLYFMRLTFWDLSWDVMEPICFFVTSMHFFMGYTFFLRTSKEPTFEGYFRGRFATKQKRLMEKHNFDVQRYYALRRACHVNSDELFKNAEGNISC